MKKYSRKWEKVSSCSSRLKVHGGWILETYGETEQAFVFIPDPEHLWILEEEGK